MPRRSELAGSVDPVPGLSQLRVAPCQLAPGTRRTDGHQRSWLGEGVAAGYTGAGGGIDRARVVAQGSVVLSRAAVAPGADGLKQDTG